MLNKEQAEKLLFRWIDEMVKSNYPIASASFCWDNMIDFVLWVDKNE